MRSSCTAIKGIGEMRDSALLAAALVALLPLLGSCQPAAEAAAAPPVPPAVERPAAQEPRISPQVVLVQAARRRIALDETYDPSYFSIPYPNGDVPNDRGVCTDVVIRAYRHLGIDLQVLVHEDMAANFSSYPQLWGLPSTDSNIDHRRVPNLRRFFERQHADVAITSNGRDYLPGDLVTWLLPGNLTHIGIVSDRRVAGSDRPLILHNIGAGTAEEDILFTYEITGHYRYFPAGS